MTAKEWTLQWFEKGDHDLQAANAIFKSDDAPYDMACFHTQQCIEKYLKGFLTFHAQEVRRTHDLVSLLAECSRIEAAFEEWGKGLRRIDRLCGGDTLS